MLGMQKLASSHLSTTVMPSGRSKVAALLIVAGVGLLTMAGSARVSADANETAITGTNAGAQASITAGGAHTCALFAAGGVKCWGENGDGQLGDDINYYRLTPTQVFGLASGVGPTTTTEPAATTTGPATTAVPQLPATGGNPTGGLVPFATIMVLIGVSMMAVRRKHI